MNKIILLEISYDFNGINDSIHPTVIIGGEDIILVDCGYVGFLPKIEDALIKNGIEPSSVTKIIITHHDHDHIGALAEFKEKYPDVKIAASKLEAEYINGNRKSLQLSKIEAMLPFVPEENKKFLEGYAELLRSVKPVEVDIIISGGEHLSWCEGIDVIDSNGHTPGHISLGITSEDVVIAGDAMALESGLPVIANPQFTYDKESAEASLKKLLRLKINRYICYHGGIYSKTIINQK